MRLPLKRMTKDSSSQSKRSKKKKESWKRAVHAMKLYGITPDQAARTMIAQSIAKENEAKEVKVAEE